MLVVGIDVGGTRIKFGLVEDGKVIRSMEQGTNAFDIIRQLCNGAREIVQQSDKSWDEVNGVGVGFPGMVINSVVLDSPNISLQNCNLKEILENELGKFVIVKNDAEMATIAEHKMGSGAGCNNMVLVTLGTGVGGGIISNKRLYVGAGGAGELGHILFEKNGRSCACGRKGCAEQYVSMKALDSLAKDIMVGYPNTCVDFNGDGLIYASELAKAYKRNDACAIEIVDKYVDYLTDYLLDLCNLFRPNRIVIGGGITHAPEIIDMVARNCRRLGYGYRNSPKVDILAAQLGNQAGVLGGYVSVEEELNPKDMEDVEEDNSAIDFQSNIDNMSLLDSITRNLDIDNSYTSQFGSVVGVDNDSLVEEPNGLYVNSVLEDISSQINNIKNEQLFGGDEEEINEEEMNDYSSDSLVSVYQSDEGETEDDTVGEVDMSSDKTDFMSAISTINEIAEEDIKEDIQEDESGLKDEDSVDITPEEVVEDIEYNAESTDEEDEYDSEDSLSLGLNDIFFGTAEEHEDKLDKIDISTVNIVDDNIIETAPVVEESQENKVNEVNNVADPTVVVEQPTVVVNVEPVAQPETSMVYDVTMVEEYVEKPKQPVDNSIFIPPVAPVVPAPVQQEPVESTPANVDPVQTTPSADVAKENTAALLDTVTTNIISDYSKLLDAMGKIDLANAQQAQGPNLLSRVNKMLDTKDQE